MIEKVVIGIGILLLLAVGLYFMLRSGSRAEPKEPIVLGQQLADALEKEKELRAKGGTVPSPMPSGGYEVEKGQWGLLNATAVPFDQELRNLCASFAAKSSDEREEDRAALTLDDFYVLLTFAERAALFALRAKDETILRDGLAAVAMIAADRTDYRDILVALAILRHAAERIGADVAVSFETAAKIAEPGTGKLIADIAGRPQSSSSLGDSWGRTEVVLESGIGLVSSSFQPYQPTRDLLKIAMHIAELIEKDSYYAERIEIATDLPAIWLEAPQNDGLDELLAKSVAGATVSGRLEESVHSDPWTQQFTIFIIELDSAESAAALLGMAKAKKPEGYLMRGFAHEKVFALLIARSVMEGKEAFETADSLERFLAPLQEALSGAGR